MTQAAPHTTFQGRKALWQVEPGIPRVLLDQLTGLSPMLCHILYCRGYRTAQEILDFFTLGEQPHNPLLMPDMDRAVARVALAIERAEQVAIYGDFDCDGLTSAAILAETLRGYGLDPVVYIPTREEGHGLHAAALHQLASQHIGLVITSDCGVTAIDEVEVARALGIDVIVTDHHEVRADGSLPACPVVNPTRHDSLYPCRHLCGVGVAYKLAQALADALPGGPDLEGLLDLVALGTVADVVPLRGENRWLVARGLRRLQQTQRPGLLALFEVAGIDHDRIDPVSIGYYLAPRVNAANRLATPQLAYALLTAQDRTAALELAERLSEFNRQRQLLVERYLEGLIDRLGDPSAIAREVQRGERPAAFIEVGDWPAGISGLLASKLVDHYGIPAFVGTRADDGVVAVSVRGIEGVYVDELLEGCEAAVDGGLFLGYGGHARAGGFRVEPERWDVALATLHEQVHRQVAVDVVGNVLTADAEVPLRKLTIQAGHQVRTLAPFGPGFDEPLFLVRRVTLRAAKPVGSAGQHARLALQQADTRVAAVHFNADPQLFALPPNTELDVLCHLHLNEWRGTVKAELSIRDWRLAG